MLKKKKGFISSSTAKQGGQGEKEEWKERKRQGVRCLLRTPHPGKVMHTGLGVQRNQSYLCKLVKSFHNHSKNSCDTLINESLKVLHCFFLIALKAELFFDLLYVHTQHTHTHTHTHMHTHTHTHTHTHIVYKLVHWRH